jgi:N-acyl homoserine lactone hydrolase
MGDYSIWVLDYAAVEKFPLSVMLYGPQAAGLTSLSRVISLA